ncbi:hypothetical protein WIW50_17285 [Flavobacteriaceae bacterium 3-367]|uniref:hypothetical protein n=1 Tax=Eudoraea algarum TaxID=3417568 RepID=UPI0032720AE7
MKASSIHKNIAESQNILIENIKVLLYKNDIGIFDYLDFNDDCIYQEPLLFAYFKSKKESKADLNAILYGYIKPHLRLKNLKVTADKFGRVYLPNLGWFVDCEAQNRYELNTLENGELTLTVNGKECKHKFEPLKYIKNSRIEILKYPITLLNQFYHDVNQTQLEVEISDITARHSENLNRVFDILKQTIPAHFELINRVTKKIVIFNVDTTLRNSFAALSAHGIGFINAYQEEYNEVFFIDDIAHQTGHIIFNTLIYDIPKFIKTDPSTIIQTLHLGNGTTETRSLYIIFHALYTYYTTFTCLNACLARGIFSGKKRHEALGRIHFYLGKCYQDLSLIENHSIGAEMLFTNDGLKIYLMIKSMFIFTRDKWISQTKKFDMSNQPYNFTFSKFLELNQM